MKIVPRLPYWALSQHSCRLSHSTQVSMFRISCVKTSSLANRSYNAMTFECFDRTQIWQNFNDELRQFFFLILSSSSSPPLSFLFVLSPFIWQWVRFVCNQTVFCRCCCCCWYHFCVKWRPLLIIQVGHKTSVNNISNCALFSGQTTKKNFFACNSQLFFYIIF